MSVIRYMDYHDFYHRVEELDVTRVYPTQLFDRKLAAKHIVSTLQEWCENQGYIMPIVTYKSDGVHFTIGRHTGQTRCLYYFKFDQLNGIDDVEKGIKNVMEHFENNLGKRAELARNGLEGRNIPMVGARCLPKSLLNTIYGNYRVSQEALDYIKEVDDSMFKRIPDITKVIHNDPATIVFWSDGTKTVVKAENEAYDPEKGIAMAITKRVLGNKGNYYNTIRKWLPKEEE